MQIEQKMPGRIFCMKLTCTRYKSTTTLVFNNPRRQSSGFESTAAYDDDGDDDDEEPSSELKVPHGKPAAAAGPVSNPSKGAKPDGPVAKQPGAWQLPRKPAKQRRDSSQQATSDVRGSR